MNIEWYLRLFGLYDTTIYSAVCIDKINYSINKAVQSGSIYMAGMVLN